MRLLRRPVRTPSVQNRSLDRQRNAGQRANAPGERTPHPPISLKRDVPADDGRNALIAAQRFDRRQMRFCHPARYTTCMSAIYRYALLQWWGNCTQLPYSG